MEPKKTFRKDGLAFSLIKKSDELAAYSVCDGPRILYYLLLAIKNGELVFNEHEIRSLTVLRYQWNIIKRKIENLKTENKMEPKTIDLQHLCEKINNICPDNQAEISGNSLVLNGVKITITGSIVNYQSNKCRVTSTFELVRLLKTDKILRCNLQDLTYLSTSPTKHSHTIK